MPVSERSAEPETTREWVTDLLGRTPEAETIIGHIERLERRAVVDLDALERRAVEAITNTYGPVHKDDTAAFWAQKGIEGMRLAVAEWSS